MRVPQLLDKKLETGFSFEHTHEQIETVADKMKEHEVDNLGFKIFEKVDKDLGLLRGTAWDASGWKDYCDYGFGDV